MKVFNCILCLATAGSFVAASPSPHRHHHQHRHGAEVKRSPDHTKVVSAMETVKAYELNGEMISHDQVCQGIKSGKLKWANADSSPIDCDGSASKPQEPIPSSSVVSTSSAAAEPVVAVQQSASYGAPSLSSAPESTSAAAPPTHSSSAAPAYSPSSSGGSDDSQGSLSATGLDKEFPDNEVDCSDFPSEYGAVPITWEGIGGWSGIQYVEMAGGFVNKIDTAVPGGDNCTAGAMCSYACPPGYQKSQWPTEQGSTGQSVGGLLCNQQNKLVKTNPEFSKTLCVKGTGSTSIVNKLSTNAAICRTDYPGKTPWNQYRIYHSITNVLQGTESETVPTPTFPGETVPLTCPDSAKYYKHEGKSTTAQYYINNKGVPMKDACTWGTDGSSKGNWAPSYLGVGRDTYGKTWLSISSTAQNNPTKYQPLDYTVEIVGDNLSGKCKLSGGQYCSGANYDDCNEQGCTVSICNEYLHAHNTNMSVRSNSCLGRQSII